MSFTLKQLVVITKAYDYKRKLNWLGIATETLGLVTRAQFLGSVRKAMSVSRH